MSQAQLRQRRPDTQSSDTKMFQPAVGLALSSLLNASPQEHGPVYKLRVPLFYSILPHSLQKLISRVWFLSVLFAPRWERRYLVLLGSYLYKFVENAQKQQQPKGSPIPLESIDISLLQPESDAWEIFVDNTTLPTGCKGVVCVSTFRKNYYYGVSDREQALTWVNTLRQAKDEALRRSMGHAHQDSYPKSWAYYDTLGRSLCKQKDRIRRRLDEKNMHELEMSQISAGSTMPRGYFS